MSIKLEPGKRLVVHREAVRPEWIDYNGHMNVAYYVLALDHAVDEFFDFVGLSPEYRAANQVSTFALEAHITYLRELKEGDPMRFEIQLLDIDAKRFHYINCLYHDTDGYLAATGEWISMHMDMRARRPAPFLPDVMEKFEAVMAAHQDIARPVQVGHVIGIPRK
jgi:acyl-CoA thioester hydrolase